MAEQMGCLQGQDRLAVTHPSSCHARRCLIRLSCDNTAAFAMGEMNFIREPHLIAEVEDACNILITAHQAVFNKRLG
ncbi:hypothetical protein J6590_106000, partial [Homalodisca vitripennis]